ncbi:hypothetical protein MX659_07020 [Coriobacteriia bacterium Es71-Z0120]|uniref:cytochrome c3 family protein n=1 Tax=Parvivirga hydrogeniphila TaxID=2939460 RepID=UPI00226103CC|nr:cytochrome c3 family protein [Parvivirga hydrogeniphila]MCL4079332.1 hypothetical protein [Parvivirga hydrogeniphila]
MSDAEVTSGPASEDQRDRTAERRGRLAFGVALLVLLLACGVTTIVQTYTTKTPEQIQRITRNLECLQCHSELIPQFSYPTVHDPFMRKDCTTCHTPHGHVEVTSVIAGAKQVWQRVKTLVEWLPLKVVLDVFSTGESKVGEDQGGQVVSKTEKKVKGKDSEPTLPKNELCWMCHGDMGPLLSEDYPHVPFEEGRCTECHEPHASKFRALLTQDERDLCVTCHPIGRELNREQVHPPAGGRWCLNCHDPHASGYRGILVDNQRDLCFTCHPSVAPLSLKPVQHHPFLYDNCTGCHEPHGSDYTPLLIEYQPGLCYRCHPGIKYDFLKPSHHPVGTVELNCADCHNPHAADYPALLSARNNAMCYQCHKAAIQATYDRSAHFQTLCVRCHTPHGSNWAPLLIKPNPEVCFQCHAPTYFDESSATEYRNNHPVRPTHYDVKARRPLTCTSTCHNPHGTQHNYMLRNYDFPKDGNCLICHRVVPGKRVGIDF